jgi:hypothetical protein
MDQTENVRDFWTGLISFFAIAAVQIAVLSSPEISNPQGTALMVLIIALFVTTLRCWSPKKFEGPVDDSRTERPNHKTPT